MSGHQAMPESFESALAEFEALVEKMERGDLTLEDSVGAYERGVVLHRYCEEALSAAERKIRILTDGPADEGGNGALQDFEPQPRSSGTPQGPESGTPPPAPVRGRTATREAEEDDIPF